MNEDDILYIEFAMERRHLRVLRALMAVAVAQHIKTGSDQAEVEALDMLKDNIETSLEK